MKISITKKCITCETERNKGEFYGKSGECKSCKKARVKKWSLENPKKRKEIANKYARNNKEKQDDWREKNKEAVNLSKRKYYAKNKDKVRRAIKKWFVENPYKAQEYKRNRRARLEGVGGKITSQEWRNLCNEYGNKCLCCGEEKELTLDHVTPLSKGGEHSIKNAQPLCLICNLKKAQKFTDYRERLFA